VVFWYGMGKRELTPPPRFFFPPGFIYLTPSSP